MIEPRYYQLECNDALFNYFEENTGNPVCAIPTGCGKSVCISMFLMRAFYRYPHQKVLVLTHVKELIIQNFKELLGMWSTAPAGINSAALNQRDYNNKIIFAGIASIHKYSAKFGKVDIIIIDECHLVNPTEATMYKKFLEALTAVNPYLKVIGFTATPWRMGHGKITEDGIFTDFCYDITDMHSFNRLIAEGFMAPLIPKQTNLILDTSGVKIGSDGDYAKGDLQIAVDKYEITVEALKEAMELAHDRNHWLIFGSGIEHCNHIAEILTELGIECKAIHSKIGAKERDTYIEDFKSGKLRAVVNNNVLCLDEKTEILTDKGWTNIDEMSYEHHIASWETDDSIVFTKPKFIVKRDRKPDEKMVVIKGRGKDIRVTSNHRMVVKTGVNCNWGIKPAVDIVGKKVLIPCSGQSNPKLTFIKCDEIDKDTIRKRINSNAFNYRKNGMSNDEARELSIKNTNINISRTALNPHELTNEHCQFIGFWLGDGTLSPRCEFGQSMVHPKIVNWFDELLKKLNFTFSRSINNNLSKNRPNPIVRWSIAKGTGSSSQSCENGYYQVEPYLIKNGTDLFWSLNEEQFENLLYGLWMADGNHYDGFSKPINGTFVCGTLKKLFDLLQAIGSCRGYKINLHELKSRNDGYKTQYRLTWKKAKSFQVVNERAEIETDFKNERVWCVTSTSGKLITRRNGKVAVVGNTTGFNHKPIDLIIVLRPTTSVNLWVQLLGRGTRPSPETQKENCLVLDFAGNTRRLGPINDPVIPKRKGDKGGGTAPVKLCPSCSCYNHATVRFCTFCDSEFIMTVKINETAGVQELIKGELPLVETFKVDHITYAKHSKIGSKPSLKVSYYSNLRTFSEYICVEHEGYAKNKANMWWKIRANCKSPDTILAAMYLLDSLKKPSHINVWTNKKFPEIMQYNFDEELSIKSEVINEKDKWVDYDDSIPFETNGSIHFGANEFPF